ncbi:MAG: hypothetical protein KDE27_02800 [Planctomycetes bacterium]|nr:hypothetical protein [Planctomycetota bacterium]
MRVALPVAVLLAAVALPGQCVNSWIGGYGCPGTGGAVNAAVLWDPDGSGPLPPALAIGGWMPVAGDIAVDGIVLYDTASARFASLPAPPSAWVTALTVLPNGDLVAACRSYDPAGDVTEIAAFDGVSWRPLGGRFDGVVATLLVRANGDLLAGGSFTQHAGVPTSGLAQWFNGSWQPFQGGVASYGVLDGTIADLCEAPGGDVVAVGRFVTAGGVAANGIARWNGSAWTAFGAGLPSLVWAVAALPTGEVFAGTSQGLSRWNGTTWVSVPGLFVSPYLAPTVDQLRALPSGDLLVAGQFLQVAGQASSALASYRHATATWSTFGTGISNGNPNSLSGWVAALVELPNGELFVGGLFDRADSIGALNVAIRSPLGFRALHDGPVLAPACCLALDDDDFVVGGSFLSAGNVPAQCVARRRGGVWQTLGSGMATTVANAYADVADLVRLPNGDILAGGGFTIAGGVAVQSLARWDGTVWSDVGGGVGYSNGNPGRVDQIRVLPGGDLLVGGSFHSAGGVPANNLARFDGVTWTAPGGGVPDGVVDIRVRDNGNLVVLTARELLEWDGASWTLYQQFGSSEAPRSVAVLRGGGFLVGGVESLYYGSATRGFLDVLPYNLRLVTAALGRTQRVARLIDLPNGDVLVTGSMLELGGVRTPGMVRWIAASATLDRSTVGAEVWDADTFPNGDLLVVGALLGLPGAAAHSIARLTTSCPATADPAGAGCSGTAGPNVLTAITLPWLGSDYTVTATGMPANGLAVTLLGAQTASTPLATLSPQAGANCDLLVTPLAAALQVTSANPLTFTLPIPDDRALVGATLHQQVLALELTPQSQPLLLTSTNRLTLEPGRF